MSINVKDPASINEVQAYCTAKARLQAFKDANPKFFEMLEMLVNEYNITREAAEKAVRTLNVSCGDFDYYQTQMKVDGGALHDALGRAHFLKVGGTIKMEAKYTMDKKKLDLAVAQGLIPSSVATAVSKEEPRYHVPDALVLP